LTETGKGLTLYAPLNINRNNIPELINRIYGPQKNMDLNKDCALYYYPFYLFEVRLDTKSWLGSKSTKVYFAVDAIRGCFTLIATLLEQGSLRNEDASLLRPILSVEEAGQLGIQAFKARSRFSLKHIFCASPKARETIVNWQLVYKPFWLVGVNGTRGPKVSRVIDGSTGEVGGVQGYRFIQGFLAVNNKGREIK